MHDGGGMPFDVGKGKAAIAAAGSAWDAAPLGTTVGSPVLAALEPHCPLTWNQQNTDDGALGRCWYGRQCEIFPAVPQHFPFSGCEPMIAESISARQVFLPIGSVNDVGARWGERARTPT